MISENYIYKYYQLSKCTVKLNQLKIRVLNSIYNQYFNFFLNNTTGRQKTHVANQLCKLWFFIHFNCSLGNSKLNTKLLGFVIGSTDPSQIAYYKNILIRLHLIERTINLKEYTKDNKINYVQDNTEYRILENEHYKLDINSNVYKELIYTTLDMDYINNIKSIIKSINPIIPNPPITLDEISSQLLVCPSMSCARRYTALSEFNFDRFLSNYSRLEYLNLLGELDKDETNMLHFSIAKLNSDGRIYHRFHAIPSYYRKSRLYLDGELLVENFDIHNAYWQFMNCILPDKINFTERNNFYKLTTSGLFYEDVRDWINKTFDANWTREDAKLYSNTYCNTTTKYNETLKSVDAYFKENFPEIRNFIRNYKTEKQSVTKKIINKHGKKVNHTTTKKVSLIYKTLNEAETKIMVMGICKELFENYGIEALTLHDGLYMKKSDYDYMQQNNIKTEDIFLKYLDLYKSI